MPDQDEVHQGQIVPRAVSTEAQVYLPRPRWRDIFRPSHEKLEDLLEYGGLDSATMKHPDDVLQRESVEEKMGKALPGPLGVVGVAMFIPVLQGINMIVSPELAANSELVGYLLSALPYTPCLYPLTKWLSKGQDIEFSKLESHLEKLIDGIHTSISVSRNEILLEDHAVASEASRDLKKGESRVQQLLHFLLTRIPRLNRKAWCIGFLALIAVGCGMVVAISYATYFNLPLSSTSGFLAALISYFILSVLNANGRAGLVKNKINAALAYVNGKELVEFDSADLSSAELARVKELYRKERGKSGFLRGETHAD